MLLNHGLDAEVLRILDDYVECRGQDVESPILRLEIVKTVRERRYYRREALARRLKLKVSFAVSKHVTAGVKELVVTQPVLELVMKLEVM